MSLNENHNNSMFCFNDYWDSINKKMIMYEEELEKKEELISKLKQKLNEQRSKCYSCGVKFKNIKEQYNKFQAGKDKLNNAIKLLKENLISYEEKIKALEEINSNNEKEINRLKNEVNSLTSQLNIANSKLSIITLNKTSQNIGKKISYFK
ncbi:hypothetical protein [Clostridium sp.]|jgi:chromosome segregation ATPase|uniref:hypothetical protein n=1 Tax=Clostridium sp. TaxID=1506 RepID=UPI0039F5B021